MIHTAVAILKQEEHLLDVAVETVRVRMDDVSDEQLDAYMGAAEWVGKAGAYAIQGRGGDLVSRIEGDFTAVVGLPLRLTARLLRARGVPIPVDIEQLYQEKPYPNWARFAV